ncbi:MAG TPA: alpha/beta hydrolase [Actinomycetes bacterium]|nr:alpha/beta hydrolase [Actinomycetes bacterium]
MEQRDVTLHGHRMTYRVAGDRDLPVLVLIHGMTSSSATWEPVMRALAPYAHVIAPDLLGHGDSDKPRTDYSVAAFASSVRDLLDHLGHERVTVVGHSLGGGVGMQFAYQYVERCERLVLVGSGGLGSEVSWLLRSATLPGAGLALDLIANKHVRNAGVLAARVLRPLPLGLRPSVIEVARGYASLADRRTRDAFVQTVRHAVGPGGQRISASERLYLGEGRPTLIVWGALDSVIPVAHAFAAHAAIPGSMLEVFEQARHFPHRDEPARFARVLRQFLDSTEPARIDAAQRQRLMARRGRH